MAANFRGQVLQKAVENLEKELDDISSKSFSDSFIFRVPHHLRQVNARVFEPQIFSIGPYHCDKDHLKAMKIHKVRYLRNFLQRTATPLETYVAASISMEESARNCYAEAVNMSSGEFVAMMVLDGLFIIELMIYKFGSAPFWREENDIFKQKLNLTILAQDLLLLENQLPFFVLDEFLSITEIRDRLYFVLKIFDFFSTMLPNLYLEITLPLVVDDIKHLLAMVHDNGLVSTEASNYHEPPVADVNLEFILSATELSARGIQFKKGKGKSLFDIKFENGVMHIPTLRVNRDTERFLRNLIAYERLNQGSTITMDYARFMDCLINYADDVALLSDCGIIQNWLGTHEEVANMFNNIDDYVHLSADFYYSSIISRVNDYCDRRWNLLKLRLRHKYFHTPWDWVLMSIFAATILLFLSLVQSIFSVLAYFK
ncbi:hypothetical protein DITRI_Ditri06bG0147600 [Diplodiscus trichospermus]